MANVFFGLNIGRSSLLAHQAALDVTGHNLANIQTEGYSRQRVEFGQAMPVLTPQGSLGSGVNAERIERIQYAHMERQIQRVASQNGYDVTLAEGIDELQAVLGEPSSDGLNGALSEFWNAWETLSARPADAALRAQVIDRAGHVAELYNRVAQGLTQAEAGYDQRLADLVAEVNGVAAQLADLNGSIVRAEAGGFPANDLRDQRDRLVRQLSESLAVDVELDGASVNLRVGGGGPYLVNRGEAYELTGTSDGDGHLGDFHVGLAAAEVSGGTAGALLELRDELSPGLRRDLADWMATVVTAVNELHTAAVDRDGQAGRNLFLWQGEADSVSLAPSTGIAAAAPSATLEPGTHHLAVTADADLSGNTLGDLSAGTIDLEYTGSYEGATLNLDYHVQVVAANAADGSLDGLQIQLYRGDEAVGAVVAFDAAAGASQTDVALGTVDGLTFTADVSLLASESFTAGERSDGWSTKGTAALDGGAAVAVDLTTQNNLTFTGGGDNGFTAGGTVTVNFAGKAFDGAAFTVYGPSATLAVDPVVAADTDKVAAARPPEGGGAPPTGDGEMARRLADLATEKIFEAVDETASGFFGRIVQSVGAQGRDARVFEEASRSVLLQLEAQRANVSGVNLDEEMVLLIQYQRGFEAAARFVTTVDGMLETLVNRLGLVGR
ncbi:MAG: hypothetical protein Kow0092_14400 [Deferrisomatales bacterium]